jgi:dihydroflavonol-4-reductase
MVVLDGLPLDRVVGDILLPHTLPPALDGINVVFHAAAEAAYWRRPHDVIPAAIEGTRHVVEAARQAGVRRLVLTSSMAAMGLPRSGELLTEDHTFDLPPEAFPYGYAKYQSELEAQLQAGSQLEVVIVNPSVVLGPGDVHQISGSLVIEAARGRTFLWLEGGVNVVHIDDVIDGHVAAWRRGRPGQRYLLGGENLTHRQVFTILAEIVGRRPPAFKLPQWAVRPGAAIIDGLGHVFPLPLDGNQLRHASHFLWCEPSRARSELGLPEPIPFRTAAQQTYDWYRQQGVL